MIRAFFPAASIGALALVLGACNRQPQPQAAPSQASAISPAAAAPAAPQPSATPTAEITTPGQPSLSRDPAEVLRDWAKAVQMRDWATVRAFWGDKGERSALSAKDFAARWSSLLDPRVTVYPGQQEGAAGSLYYTAPVRIIDGPRTVRGEIVLRRVNDVPGATEEQLRWHIESTTLEP